MDLGSSENQSDEIKTFHKKLKSAIESLGGELVTFKDTRVYPNQEYYERLYEFREGLERYLKNSNSKIKTLEDIIAFNDANSDKVMPHFGQDILYLSSESRNIFRYWFSKWKLKNSYRDTLDILEQNKLDAFIGLTRGPMHIRFCRHQKNHSIWKWSSIYITIPFLP